MSRNSVIPPEVKTLLSRRKRFIDQIEVLNIECAVINKAIAENLLKHYGGNKCLVFEPENRIVYRDARNVSYMGITSEDVFVITEVRSNNSYEEIEFFLLSAKSKNIIIVPHDQFHSFKFI